MPTHPSIPEVASWPPWLAGARAIRGLALGWLAVASALLWHVGPGAQARWTSNPDEAAHAFVFDREAIAEALGLHAALLVPASYAATVLHISAQKCRCERRSEPHRARIEAIFAPRAVRFMQVSPDDPFAESLRAVVPAAPAAVVLDPRGRVVYAGPYASDRSCLPRAGQEGAVEQRLDALLAGERLPLYSPLGVGCLCPTTPSP